MIEIKNLSTHGLILDNSCSIGSSILFEVPVRASKTAFIKDVEMGAFSYIGPGAEIRACTIGRFCSLAANVSLAPAEHPIEWVSSHPIQFDGLTWFSNFPDWHEWANPKLRWRNNSGRVVVGHDVWIGRNVVIRQGVKVGSGAIIGSNSFVNKDVQPYSIVAGNPAKEIRLRFSENIIQELLGIEWWNWMPPSGEQYCFDDVNKFIIQFSKWRDEGLLRKFDPARKKVIVNKNSYIVTDV